MGDTNAVETGVDTSLLPLLGCPRSGPLGLCGGALVSQGKELCCNRCGTAFPVVRGVPLLHDEPVTAHYERAYVARSRTHELGRGIHAAARVRLGEMVRQYAIHGPSLEISCSMGMFADALPQYIGLDYSINALVVSGFEGFNRVFPHPLQVNRSSEYNQWSMLQEPSTAVSIRRPSHD